MKVNISKCAVSGLAKDLDASLGSISKWGFGPELAAVRKARDVVRGIEMQIAAQGMETQRAETAQTGSVAKP